MWRTVTAALVVAVACALVEPPAAARDARRAGLSGPPPGQNDPKKEDWIQLFNGKNLDGWTPKFAKHDLGENFNDTVRVENGILEDRATTSGRRSAASSATSSIRIRSRIYRLAAEYRFVGQQVPGGPPMGDRATTA